jgi:hypothetical protein
MVQTLFYKLTFIVWIGASLTVQAAPIFWTDEDWNEANTARYSAYMSETEKEVVIYLNLLRKNPTLFAEVYLKPYSTSQNSKVAEIQEVIAWLEQQTPKPLLYPAMALHASATKQARYLKQFDDLITAATEQAPFYDRIHRYSPGAAIYAETWCYGSEDPLIMIIRMLIGENGASEQDRQVLMSENLEMIGVSVVSHETHCATTVLNFIKQAEPVTHTQFSQKKKRKSINFYEKDCPHKQRSKRKGLNKILFWRNNSSII